MVPLVKFPNGTIGRIPNARNGCIVLPMVPLENLPMVPLIAIGTNPEHFLAANATIGANGTSKDPRF